MTILTPEEKEFLDVFLHEATTSPFFKGLATKALYAIGVEYRDISYIAWAYEQDVPRTSFEIGHAADVAPPLRLDKPRVCSATEHGDSTHLRAARRPRRERLSGRGPESASS